MLQEQTPAAIEDGARANVGHNRVRLSTRTYRAVMEAIEARRVELGLPMSQVDDLAGLQDGLYAKAIHVDAPSGRQIRWESLDLLMQVLFGREFSIAIVAHKSYRAPKRLETRANPSAKTSQAPHWRHRKIFQALGRLGGLKRASLPPERRSEIARKAAATRLATRLAKRRAAASQADAVTEKTTTHSRYEPCVGGELGSERR